MKKHIFLLSNLVAIIYSCEYTEDNETGLFDLRYDNEFTTTGEQYNTITENPFINTSEESVSTFSIDADGASYANTRRYINKHNQLPPKDAIRTEELLNYFTYDYPEGDKPVTINTEVSSCPWADDHHLLRIGLKGKSLNNAPASNLVFLIDVSGSMSSEDKLTLLKQGLISYLDEIQPTDMISIVTYAGSAGVLLDGALGVQKQEIKDAINKLGAGGSTAGARGIITAYEIAQKHFIHEGNNRIILGTDGDFNVGPSSQDELIKLIESKRDEGVYLTVLGLGTGNYQEGTMEQLANNGNGTFEYLDSSDELLKVFVFEKSKFFTAAKDVKIQVQFDPAMVNAYRLLGYENRGLTNNEFDEEDADAGEIGAGQTVTAIYEIVPAKNWSDGDQLALTQMKYKDPSSYSTFEDDQTIAYTSLTFDQASESMRFSASVIGFGLLMRDSPHKGSVTWEQVQTWAENAMTFDPNRLRADHVSLLKKARSLQ